MTAATRAADAGRPTGAPARVARKLRVPPRAPDNPLPPASVTVVIPCFNYARFLPQAVESALSQTGVRVDVVIVDDASTDDSLVVARDLAARHGSIQVLAHEVNGGPVRTFNDGLALASGEFLVRLDADDLLTPGSLSRAVALARAFPSVGLVYGHPLHFATERPEPRTAVRSWTVWPGGHWLADRCRSGLNVITSPEVVMRRSVVEVVGGQQPLAHTHDMEMWLRIAAFSDVARVDGADQAWHRDHPDSLSSRHVDPLTDLAERRAAFDTLFDGIAGTRPDAPALRRLAQQAIARDALVSACHLMDRGRASQEAIDTLVELARAVEPDGPRLREWGQLERRTRIGLHAVHRRPWFVAAALRRRVRLELRRRRWHRHGVWERDRGPVAAPTRR